MKIEKLEVLVSSPGRNFVTVRITTDTGITGLGDGTLNGRELAVVSYLQDHLFPLLEGLDADRIEHIWQYLYRGAYWRRGPVTMAAIAAIDVALWDIKAKAAGVPLYQLLGGKSRERLLVYTHASGKTVDDLFSSVDGLLEQGYKAIRLQVGLPGLETIYGTSTRDEFFRGETALPLAESWDTRKYLNFIPGVFKQARERYGRDLILLHDSHHRLRPIEAARLAKELEPYDLWWLEDVTPGENTEALRLVREKSHTPLAIGEVFNTVWDTLPLIQNQLIDYVRMAVTHSGGVSALKKILDVAGFYQIKSGIHGPEDISPVGMAAAIHIGFAIHNFGIQEFGGYQDPTLEVFKPSYQVVDGFIELQDTPGLGVTYDDDVAGAYPYQRSYLPTNQLMDGTVHDW